MDEVAGLAEEREESVTKKQAEVLVRSLKALKLGLGRFWRRQSATITDYDPTYRVAYLGNVLTGWAKGEGCTEKPVGTLWRNYCSSSRSDVAMTLTIGAAGLRATTKEHGLTEYWSHRVTYCAAPPSFPRVFCWVYRHEGRRLKQELRCHAVLCSKASVARTIAAQLQARLAEALREFRRDKLCRQQARLSLANAVYAQPSLPKRRIMLSTGATNYRPPLERSKSAPKLGPIDEICEEEFLSIIEEPEEEEGSLSSESGVVVAPAAGEDVMPCGCPQGGCLCCEEGPDSDESGYDEADFSSKPLAEPSKDDEDSTGTLCETSSLFRPGESPPKLSKPRRRSAEKQKCLVSEDTGQLQHKLAGATMDATYVQV
ncbi:protein FAM43A isoform X2 [Neocloeon triangulifer]|nr:protein FAM43A isoform X2 [Neocloeon triangulifer]